MKKLLLVCLLSILPQFGNALIIQNIIVSPVSDAAIDVQVNTQHNYTFGYNSFQYAIDGNVITLDVCYDPGFGAAISYSQDHFEISLDNTVVTNYQLIVNVYFTNATTFICDYQIVEHSQTLPFSTPLTEPVYLGIDSFSNATAITIYPNPTTGILQLGGSTDVTSVTIYDCSGRFVRKFKTPSFDISDLQDGSYFLLVESENGISKHQIIKR